MKKIIVSCAIAGTILLSTDLMAQSIKSSIVPRAVTSALNQKYPKTTKVTWEKEKGNYEANWGGKSGEDMSVQFSPDGVFVEQVKAIPVSQLPSGVAKYVKSHYKRAKITEAGKVTDARGETKYEAEIKGKDVLFDKDGNFLESEKE